MRPTHASDRYAVRLFGGPDLLGPDGDVSLSPYQLALLTLVFGSRRGSLSRPRVGWLLWGEDDTPKVRHRIRQLLHGLHRRTAAELVQPQGDQLLPGDGVEFDLARFDRLVERGELRRAAELAQRGFAAGLLTFPSRELEEWRASREVTLGRRLRAAAAAAWDRSASSGDWARAHDAAEALYLQAPTDEGVVAKVIEARARVGEGGGAEAAYSAFVDARRGRSEPNGELADLMRRVRRARTEANAACPGPAEEVPFIGRKEALAKGRSVVQRVSAGQFQFMLVTGESGIGKTRLLREVARDAALQGIRCLHAQPVELERRIPLNPLLDALRAVDLAPHLRAIGEPWRSVVGSLLPPSATDGPPNEIPPIQESSIPRRLTDAFFLLLERVATEEPTILFLDDMHWADATTVTVLQFVQRRWYSGPFGVVAALRPDLLTRDDAAGQYLLEADGLSTRRVALEELSEEEALQLIDRLVDAPVDEQTRRRISEMGGRHPLYVTELTRDHLAGRLDLDPARSDDVSVPASLQRIFARRLRSLTEPAARVGAVLAVRGRPMRLVELQALTGLSLEACADAADELGRGRFVWIDGDSVAIAHDLFRMALYQSLSEARRAVLHGAVAAHLLTLPEPPKAGELAVHYARAGERERALVHAWAAANKSMESGAASEAAHFLQLIVDLEHRPVENAIALGMLGKTLHEARALSRAIPVLIAASTGLRENGLEMQALRADIRRIECLAEERSLPPDQVRSELASLRQRARALGDATTVVLALDLELQLLHRSGTTDAIGDLLESARIISRSEGQPARCLSDMALALAALYGDPTEGISAARRAVRTAEAEGLGDHLMRARTRLLTVLVAQGRQYTPEGLEATAAARSTARISGDVLYRLHAESNMVVAHLDAGNTDDAQRSLTSVEALLRGVQADYPRANYLANRAELALERGEYVAARGYFKELKARLPAQGSPEYLDLITAGLGLCALHLGDLAEARALEEQLRSEPAVYYLDPTIPIAFRARCHRRRRDVRAAIGVIEAAQQGLRDRLTAAWLKLVIMQLSLMRRAGMTIPEARFDEAVSIAADRCLSWRSAQLGSLRGPIPHLRES